MSKQYKIRWSKSDNNELARVVRNYNAKLERLAKNPSRLRNSITEKSRVADTTLIKALPEKTSVREMKSLINTRQDLKRELNTLKRFLEKGAEEIVNTPDTKYNVFVTKFQRKEMSIRAGVVNRRRKKRLDEILGTQAESQGEALGYTIGQIGMGKLDLVSLKPFNAFTPTMKQEDVHRKYKHLKMESKSSYYNDQDAIVKENFIKALSWNFDQELVDELISHIDDMSVRDFMKIFRREGNTFEWAYLPESDEVFNTIQYLKKAYGLDAELETSDSIIGDKLKEIYRKENKASKKRTKKKSKKSKRG